MASKLSDAQSSFFLCFLLLMGCAHAANGITGFGLKNITIGVLVDLDSTLGPSVKESVELAISDINQLATSENGWLNGSLLSLVVVDSRNDAFQAAAAAMELLNQEVVSIIGPQSTTGSHFVAHMCSTLQVPIISYGATDPALSEHQYTFFLRLSHNDVYQMRAVADFIRYYGWRTVVALYTDDDYGANGITALEDALMQQVSPSMFRRERLPPDIDRDGVGSVLSRLAMMESRIFVVHAQESVGLRVLEEARYLGMIDSGFVWIVTDLLAYSIEMLMRRGDMRVVRAAQGLVGIRRYVPPSERQKEVFKRWEQPSFGAEMIRRGVAMPLIWGDVNVYAMCAYDSVWLAAKGLDEHLRNGGSIGFGKQKGEDSTEEGEGNISALGQLKVLREGRSLREAMLRMNFNGTIGPVQLNENGDMEAVPFEIVNAVGRGMRVVGYWQDGVGISALPPPEACCDAPTIPADESTVTLDADGRNSIGLKDTMKFQVTLPDVVWPGGGTQVPRGWVIPQNGRPLMIGVPKRAGYKELIRESVDVHTNVTTFHGFCINVFEAAIRYLPYAVTYQFVSVNGMSENSTPTYDHLISRLANQEFDAVVGDAMITKKRLDMVDFTQPYIESGLEIIVPLVSVRPNTRWAFLQPFTPALWFTIGGFFLFTGAVIWMLEHKSNSAFRGYVSDQIITSLWFIFSTLFFAHREKTNSFLGRFVVIIWLFVVLIITSSYTASLTSILTVQQLSPSMLGIHSLLVSDAPIGYQLGSFVKEYLIDLGIKPERLVPLYSKAMYAKALRLGPDNGGVAAIVDELPYVQLFLASEATDEFTTAGQEFTKSGWAFAFPKNSQLTSDMSEAILRMSENGELQKIHNLWFNSPEDKANDSHVNSSQLDFKPFSGLFMISGLVSLFCLLVHITRLLKEFIRSKAWNDGSSISTSSSLSRSAQLIKSFALYIDEPVNRQNMHNRKSMHNNKESMEMAISHMLDATPVSSLER
ncbi:hypothetical protein KP509_28G068100 [Ceratopteris richardii]|uniref:Glutamate receptor n=1 Tax=Ceratopteris richardii TaxID=49495 RepID=A0A8T2RFI8_CERRI|nr:hypothetical protein KP509_28G068100 [Ceratopteris richardii]